MRHLTKNEIESRGLSSFRHEFDPKLMIQAADGADGTRRLPSFDMVAYNGGIVGQWYGRCVVDLSTLRVSSNTPILFNHDHEQPVGHGSVRNDGRQLTASGVISLSDTSPAAKQIVEGGKNGFPWQASIGGSDPERIVELMDGEEMEVNGQVVTGPLYVFEGMFLREISIVVNGADDRTETTITAMREKGRKKMSTVLQAADGGEYEDEKKEEEEEEKKDEEEVDAEDDKCDEEKMSSSKSSARASRVRASKSISAKIRLEAAAETRRIADIRKICAGNEEIMALAIENGWSNDKTELEVMRASRAPNVNTWSGKSQASNVNVITAAVCVAGGLPMDSLEKTFDDKTLQAAHDTYRGSIGLQEMIVQAARANGYSGRGNFKAADSARSILQAAFSNGDLPGILSNVANKFLLKGYMQVEQSWKLICDTQNVPDFKEISSYSLIGNLEYEQVGPGGEIKSGDIGEISYSNRARTFAKLLSITRTNIINDDLGALTKVPAMLGRGSALTINVRFWTEYLDNANFFTVEHGNYFDGAASVLSIDSLNRAVALFLNQTDPSGYPLSVEPKILLVPNALKTEAEQIMGSANLLVANGTRTNSLQVAQKNIHAGKYKVVSSAYLDNARIPGGSSTAWYMLADPLDLPTPVIEMCFLDGKETPTIETAYADFDVLGIQMRGFHDFGVRKQEYRGGVKSKGAE